MLRNLYYNIILSTVWVLAMAAMQPDLTFPRLFILLIFWATLILGTLALLHRYLGASRHTDIPKCRYLSTIAGALAISALMTLLCTIIDPINFLIALAAVSVTLSVILGKWAVRSSYSL